MKRITLTLSLLLVCGVATRAQEAPGEEKKQGIRRLLQLTKAAEMNVQVIDDMLPDILKMIDLQFGDRPAAEREKAALVVEEVVRAELTAEKFIERFIPIYDKHLSAEDVKALIAFWESPAGSKFAAVQQEILKEVLQDAAKMGDELGWRITARLDEEGLLKPPPPPAKKATPKRAPPARRRRA